MEAEGGEFQQYSLNRLLPEESEADGRRRDGLGGDQYKLDFAKNADSTLVDPSFGNVLRSSLTYTLRQFWLEKRNACIGTTIIMFIVCMSSFIFIFFQNASSLYFFLSQESIGDMDI